MRTKETLGYIASLIMVETCGYYGLANVIQSNSKTPEFCASRVRNFYKESFNLVKNISEEEFKLHVNVILLCFYITKRDKLFSARGLNISLVYY